ncbi:MAG: adenosine deaminase [Zhaonellaceae bacterium]|jgi:adenosine deaminase
MSQAGDSLFKEGLKEGNLSKLRQVPKAELHNHCGTGMRFFTFNNWAGGNVKRPPQKMNGVKGLNDYIFGELNKYITKEEDVAFLIEETVKEAIEDGVKVLEASIDYHEMLHFSEWNNFFDLITSIKEKYRALIDFRPEVGMALTTPRADLDKYIVPCIESGAFLSIDAYGEETKDSYLKLKEYYKYAREKGLKLKIHAGQFMDADNVKSAVEVLEVDEIQHGIGAIHSDYVQDLLKERKIRLNICPSSNYILGAVEDLKKHLARKLFDKGIVITINTDDLLLFNSGVSEEFLLLYKIGLFDEDELNEIRKNAWKY